MTKVTKNELPERKEMTGFGRMISYLMNPGLKEQTEKVFEGVESGRTKALYHWFNDTWTSIELIAGKLVINSSIIESENEINKILNEQRNQYSVFSELFILTKECKTIGSTYESFCGRVVNEEYVSVLEKKERYMYGPYIDEDTIKIGICDSKFFDQVTLMFIEPFQVGEKDYFLCGRVPNDVMSDVLQDEDSHIYKDSGDNYLFMVNTDRDIEPGTAISRSRFEDNTFTLGDNLKDGIPTKGYGTVKIKNHTEFEIIFNNPKSGKLHVGGSKNHRSR